MHQQDPDNKLLLEAVEQRYCSLCDCADAAHARDLRKERRTTSAEQTADKPSLHRKRARRHVQMIKISVPGVDEFRKDDPEQLLSSGLAEKTAHTDGDNAFRPIQKKRDRFQRKDIRNLKETAEITWD